MKRQRPARRACVGVGAPRRVAVLEDTDPTRVAAFAAPPDDLCAGTDWAVRLEQWRLAQAHELLMRFEETHGRLADGPDEVEDWATLAPVEHPVRPSDAAREKAKSIDNLELATQVAEAVDLDRTD